MTIEQGFLLDLIRASVLGDTGFVVPESVDWAILIEEASKQNVSVIASDGLQKLYDAGVYSVSGDKEERRTKARWFAKTMKYEMRYADQLSAAKKMGKWFALMMRFHLKYLMDGCGVVLETYHNHTLD